MDPECKALLDEELRIDLIAREREGLDGYFECLHELFATGVPITHRAILRILASQLFWRHIVLSLSPSMKTVIAEDLKFSQQRDLSQHRQVVRIRGYLGDATLVEDFSAGKFGPTIDEFQQCSSLGRIHGDLPSRMLKRFLHSNDESVKLQAALSLAAHGDFEGESLLEKYYKSDWEEYGRNMDVGVALARLGRTHGIGFVFSNLGQAVTNLTWRTSNYLNNLKATANEFEDGIAFDKEDWFGNYSNLLLTRIGLTGRLSFCDET